MGFYDNLGGGFNASVLKTDVDSDGKITAVGAFTTLDGLTQKFIVKLNSDGTIYSTFDIGTGPNTTLRALGIQSDKKVLVGLGFSYNGTTTYGVIRLNTDGSLDTTFNTNLNSGISNGSYSSTLNGIEIESGGKIIIYGNFDDVDGNTRGGICRLNSTGTVDTSLTFGVGFTNEGFLFPRGPEGIKVQSDGKFVCALRVAAYQNLITSPLLRLNTDGSVDSTFQSNQGTWEEFTEDYPFANCVAIQSDGKIVVGGYFWKIGTTNVSNIARFNSDGTLDTTFCSNTNSLNINEVRAIEIQSDGKILIGGYGDIIPTEDGALARLNSTGTIDSSFMTNLGEGTIGVISTIKQQSDGKILVGGSIIKHDGKVRKNLIRLNSDGTEDADDETNSNGFYFNGRLMTSANINTTNIVPFEDISYINDAYVPDTIAPGAPTSLSASNLCQTTITLSWTAPSDNDISYYKIYRDTLNITKELYANTDDGSTSIDLVGNPGDKNTWTVSAVDNAGNEGSESSALNQDQPPSVSIVTMSATGQSTSSGACSQTRDTDRYLSGATITPSNGDKIYTNACATTLFNGAGKWYSQNGLFDTWVYQISSTGVISNLTTC